MNVLAGSRELIYGTRVIDYELVFADRKTLGIYVYPDTTVVVRAPHGSSEEAIAARVRKRARWIVKHQRHFGELAPRQELQRQYVSGEAWRYLGQQRRLKVVEGQPQRVTLDGRTLLVSVRDTQDKARIEGILKRWFRRQAEQVFAERLQICLTRVEALGITPPIAVKLREMKSQWGACSPQGRVTLNLRLIHVAPPLIDYVIVHELCHLKELNHGPAYYALLDRALPDWRERREALNRAELR